MCVSPVVADIEANRPAQNTIAMNIVPIACDFLNIRTVRDINREPTTNDGLRTRDSSFDLIKAVGLESPRVKANRNTANNGMITTPNAPTPNKAKNANMGINSQPDTPTARRSMDGFPIFSESVIISPSRIPWASVGVMISALMAPGRAIRIPATNENRKTNNTAIG